MQQQAVLSPRAQKTRASLISAAAKVFPRDGFFNSRVTDITTEAGTASGSFYNYFSSKEEILFEVIHQMNQQMYEQSRSSLGSESTPYERIRAATAAYVSAYRVNAPIISILEQVATLSPDFMQLRLTTRNKFRARLEARVREWQKQGIVDDELPVEPICGALISTVSNFCYMWFVFGEKYDETEAVNTLSLVWARSLGIPTP